MSPLTIPLRRAEPARPQFACGEMILICLCPEYHMLCWLSAAYASICVVLLFQRNTTRTNARYFLYLVFTGFITAPHCFYKAIAFFCQNLLDLVHALADICPYLSIFPRLSSVRERRHWPDSRIAVKSPNREYCHAVPPL